MIRIKIPIKVMMMIFLLQFVALMMLTRQSADKKIGDMYLCLQTVKEPLGNSTVKVLVGVVSSQFTSVTNLG